MNATLLAIGAGLCWGVGELCTKSALHSRQIGPITAVAVRTTVALPVLWGAYAVAMHWAKSEPREWWRADTAVLLKVVLGSGLVAGAIALLFFYAALHVGEISRVKPVAFALAPLTAALLAWGLMGEPMTVKKAAGIALILAGVVVLTAK